MAGKNFGKKETADIEITELLGLAGLSELEWGEVFDDFSNWHCAWLGQEAAMVLVQSKWDLSNYILKCVF